MTHEPDYAPLQPSLHPAFDTALANHREILTEILIGADALQDATYEQLRRSRAARCELPFEDWVLALGQGYEAAEIAARMAGYIKSPRGRWLSAKSGKITQLRVPTTLISDHLAAWAEAV